MRTLRSDMVVVRRVYADGAGFEWGLESDRCGYRGDLVSKW